MCSNCFFSGFGEFLDAIFGRRDEGFGNDGREGSGLVAVHEVEGGHVGDRMRAVIVRELSSGEAVGPGEGVILTEDAKVDF